ncbi:MAG: DNA-processing protein DprA [Methylophilaceae bacterium]|nr:DNA-processing protein DprA [Methylophilaceae bacterium]
METKTTESDDAKFWIALAQIQGLGNAHLCQLLAKFGTPENVFNATLSQLKEVVSPQLAATIERGVDIDLVQPTLDWLKKEDTHLITLADSTYPQRLLQISNPPAILYAIGQLHWLNHPSIAMVGSRSATPQGEKNAENFAESICNQGLCVISGMALGIDGAAHRGALKSNGGTIAVVGTGLNIVYPAKHRDLAHQIAEHGLIISEFALETPSIANNFPRRNRIISGLSLGCLVVEANLTSGSMITARLATEQGREVFAIPGSIHSPVSKGCHQLIKQGAKLVENANDILEEINHLLPRQYPIKTERGYETPKEIDTLLAAMGFDPISFEALLEISGLTTEALSSMLMLLELEGKLATLAGGNYQRLI